MQNLAVLLSEKGDLEIFGTVCSWSHRSLRAASVPHGYLAAMLWP